MTGLLRRTGPLSPLLAGFVLMAGGLTVRDVAGGLAGLAALALAAPFALAGSRVSWLRLLAGVLALASVTWSNWLLASPRELEPALVAGLRVAFFVVPGIVLAAFVDPSELGDHLGQRLRLPARPVLAGVAALQQLDDLGQEWASMARARRVRGLGPDRSPVSQVRFAADLTFSLLVQALRRAERMTVAMEARGYADLARPGPDRARRTWLHPAPWTGADTTLVVLAAAVALVPVLLPLVVPPGS
ncbi:energy-coupling factor transporter transmembrane component T family protein [Agilicoccus flavus]|uniref:energy-coupling factor transporter transmembrane component T family protein n=1 Tax=Agilicoccus flavus TaxID=2775968 RepID=UPI001CF61FC1|nr:energy-coupling factor transporter transmembrane component T [Agilicoccus flavus]